MLGVAEAARAAAHATVAVPMAPDDVDAAVRYSMRSSNRCVLPRGPSAGRSSCSRGRSRRIRAAWLLPAAAWLHLGWKHDAALLVEFYSAI